MSSSSRSIAFVFMKNGNQELHRKNTFEKIHTSSISLNKTDRKSQGQEGKEHKGSSKITKNRKATGMIYTVVCENHIIDQNSHRRSYE